MCMIHLRSIGGVRVVSCRTVPAFPAFFTLSPHICIICDDPICSDLFLVVSKVDVPWDWTWHGYGFLAWHLDHVFLCIAMAGWLAGWVGSRVSLDNK
ncbi:hypothetical protein BJX96DRAFT_21091 [Aspergillus floccosus]